jgi:hypothetical protein
MSCMGHKLICGGVDFDGSCSGGHITALPWLVPKYQRCQKRCVDRSGLNLIIAVAMFDGAELLAAERFVKDCCAVHASNGSTNKIHTAHGPLVGPDRVGGSADDADVDFVKDNYSLRGWCFGDWEDTITRSTWSMSD